MPSPFPGMDPFLEHPFYFPDLHASLIFCLRESLQSVLPEPYYAVLNERLWVETSDRPIEPDVDVLYQKPSRATRKTPDKGAVAMLDEAQPILITISHDERRESYIDIMTRTRRGEKVVTTIELLSLSNKTPGEHGRELYVQKQREVLEGKINLVELDLLRGGQHTTAVPIKRLLRRAGAFDYHICIAPVYEHDHRYVYTIHLQDPLPKIAIPLLRKGESAQVDLQATFNRCYDSGPYRRRVRYSLDQVTPPLSPVQAAWVQKQFGPAKGANPASRNGGKRR